ncbi:ribonuclease 3 [Gaeumannomyces tritici R3-111a-1]|uniref:Ribonuclease 3 n=1 Tax=Gaeumannomyces tritici (strain R3-111a-1) TaxID=644352 RepID=J3PD53_GAET3|nr:ribonuclease 3 [Gaeumannomyces tritici R3-111a-1]EJT70398.1 ribonuclease 3 [Gaeumannomyces tritici R3-111a-1]
MSKHARAEPDEEVAQVIAPAKRLRLNERAGAATLMNPNRLPEPDLGDAIDFLIGHSDDLAYCMATLKQWSEQPMQPQRCESTRESVAALCQRLVPGVQELASQVAKNKSAGENPGTVAVSAHVAFTKWTSANIPLSLPPLPEVKDVCVEQAALRHPEAVRTKAMSVQENSDRLEWLGDAYLELFATCFIYETFPDLAHGKCTQIRERLIRNESLAEWTRAYGLDKRAQLPPDFNNFSANKKIKYLGDIFESYVGAIVISDPGCGVARAASWLKDVWAMAIAHKIREEEARQRSQRERKVSTGKCSTEDGTQLVAGPPKVILSRMLVVPGVKIQYVDLPGPKKKDKDNHLPIFSVGVKLDGWGESDVLLGRGFALSKREAGEKAAQMALDNKKQLKKYIDMKDAWMKQRGVHEAMLGGSR